MLDITLKERFMRSLKRKDVDKVPVCSVTQTGTVELMEITGAKWPQAHYDPEKMAILAIAGHEIAGLEAVRYPFDCTAIAQSLGCKIMEGSIDTQPSIVEWACQNKDDVKEISIPENFLESERISTILDATDIVKKRVGEDVPIIAGMIGPAGIAFSLAGENYFKWMITDPDVVKDLLEIGTEVCIEYSNALFERGDDAVCIPDSEGGPDMIPPPLFESLILPQHRKLTNKTKGMMILHMCGDATDILEPMATSGFDGISIEEKVNARYAKQVIGKSACLIGNISPVTTLLAKSPENVKQEAKMCIEDGIDILAPGCGIAPHTPLMNIRAFVEARDEYYVEQGIL